MQPSDITCTSFVLFQFLIGSMKDFAALRLKSRVCVSIPYRFNESWKMKIKGNGLPMFQFLIGSMKVDMGNSAFTIYCVSIPYRFNESS